MNNFKPFTNIPSTPEEYSLYLIMKEIEKHNKKSVHFLKAFDDFMTDNETNTQDNEKDN